MVSSQGAHCRHRIVLTEAAFKAFLFSLLQVQGLTVCPLVENIVQHACVCCAEALAPLLNCTSWERWGVPTSVSRTLLLNPEKFARFTLK